jgi:dipeptide/tripeptide permease
MGRNQPRLVSFTISIAMTVISGLSSYLASQLKQHESNVGSSWWLLLGLAGIGALLGLIVRRSAESLLDELDDESWKQRVAPLVNEQKRAIAEMWSMGVLLKAALEPKDTGSGPG